MALVHGNSSGDLRCDRRFEAAESCVRTRDWAAAEDLIRQAMDFAPHWPPLHFRLGEARMAMNDPDGARTAFLRYLELCPEDLLGAGIKIAQMGSTPEHECFSPAYVRGLFDQYASRFDSSLVGALGYGIPERAAQSLLSLRPHFESVLDLGCGTGLSGAPLRAYADRMTGVDISPAMIEQARTKQIYDRLECAEAFYFLTHDTYEYHAIVALDVLIYISQIEPLMQGIRSRLTHNGYFVCSVQDAGERDIVIGADHRASHGRHYLAKTGNSAGLRLLSISETTLRKEAGIDVPGLLAIFTAY